MDYQDVQTKLCEPEQEKVGAYYYIGYVERWDAVRGKYTYKEKGYAFIGKNIRTGECATEQTFPTLDELRATDPDAVVFEDAWDAFQYVRKRAAEIAAATGIPVVFAKQTNGKGDE